MKMFGLDSETPMGNLRVIATDQEYAEVETFDEVLNFITQRKHTPGIFFLFNLQFDVEHILKLSGDRDLLTKLYRNEGGWKGIKYKDVTLKYINGKFFKICKKGHCATFIDIAMFYKGMSLDNAAKKYFGKGKNPVNAQKIGEEPGYYEAHRQEVLEYCQVDAQLTLKLAERMKELIETCQMPYGKLSFKNPISSAKVAETYVLKNFKYPLIPKRIKIFHWIAQKAYHGGLFQTYQRGVFEKKLYCYDINSAYPSVMQHLPHWGNGQFQKVVNPDSGEYGWYLCNFNSEWIPFNDSSQPYKVDYCYKDLINCESVTFNPKRKVYPTGLRTAVITKIEFLWLVKHKFPVEFITGVEWFQKSNNYESPFQWIPEVYKRRQEVKDLKDPSEYALKIVMNGIYGKCAQFKRGMGRMTNFFYASYITAGTRLQVAEVAFAHPQNIIEIATDSVLLDSKVGLPLTKKLGDWGVSEYSRGVLIGSGLHQFYEDSETFHTHARGLTDNPKWDMEAAMYKYKNDEHVWFSKKRPIHLGEMLMHTKALIFEDLGTFVKVSKRLCVNTDKKRNWERLYVNFKDFLESPIQLSKALEVKDGVLTRSNTEGLKNGKVTTPR
jgi:hypothetical protein